jgi:hypothetical protein
MLIRAEPETAEPHAPQVLRLSPVDDLSKSRVLARSRSFFDVSLSEMAGGGLLAYVADRRTWARTIRCGKR